MVAHQRVLIAVCAALLVAGGAGAATHQGASGHRTGAPTTGPGHRIGAPTTGPTAGGSAVTAPLTTTSRPDPSSAPPPGSGPPPASTALAAGLVTPTDMGGYYRIVPSAASGFLASAPCLDALQGAPAPVGRAETALLGPDTYSMPMIIEEVVSYPWGRSASVYDSAARAVDRCPDLSFAFSGAPVHAHLSPGSIPPVGDADRVWAGVFSYAGTSFSLQLGLVLDGPSALAVVWVDSIPPAPAVMGGFTSTVSLAIGKLA